MESEVFTISPSTHVRIAAGEWMAHWWWTVIVPLLICLIVALWLPVMIVAAVAILFIVAPTVLALVYLDYALRPLAAFATRPHRVVIADNDIKVEYSEVENQRTPPAQHFPVTDISMVEDTGTNIIIHLKTSRYDFIVIPASTLSLPDAQNLLSLNV